MRLEKFAPLFCATMLMAAAPAFADVKAGVDAWSRGEYATAIKEWRPLAINGDADAQFNMGQAYKLGRGVPVDFKLAEGWYRRAADQGHLQAEDNLGLILFQNGDRQKAMPYIERSASRGEPRAQYVLATALFNGDLAKKDWVRAYALMTRASASGLNQASASLAQMDRYIPLDQRQKGLAMARDLESAEQRTEFADASPPQSVQKRPTKNVEQPIRTAGLPPSAQPSAGSDDIAPARDPEIKRQVAATPKPPVAAPPKPKSVIQPPKINGPAWRVQLGAFSDQSNAKQLWTKLQSRSAALSGLQPIYAKAGSITRLQAGPIAGKAAAERLCAAVSAGGQACLPVAP
jgi:uncharacterized protein